MKNLKDVVRQQANMMNFTVEFIGDKYSEIFVIKHPYGAVYYAKESDFKDCGTYEDGELIADALSVKERLNSILGFLTIQHARYR